MQNFNLSLDMVSSLDLGRLEEFKRTEDELDWLNNAIVAFVVNLSGRRGLGEKDHIFLSGTYRTVRDIERIGDYAENFSALGKANIVEEEIDDFTKKNGGQSHRKAL